MSKYIIPEGWTPIEKRYSGKQGVNVLLSSGDILTDYEEWSKFDRMTREPLSGFNDVPAYAVAWQLIQPLKQTPKPTYYVDHLPDWVELQDLRAIRLVADDAIVAFAFEGIAANTLRDIFTRMEIAISRKGNTEVER